MSFLNQLKSQANALQAQQNKLNQHLDEFTAKTEGACLMALNYLQDLARQLNVIEPAAPKFTLDGKTAWPEMKMSDFRVDSRRKVLRSREVFDYISLGWQVVPRVGKPVGGVVSANFPPDVKRVENRLFLGQVKHERRELRHPEKNSLLAYEYDYVTEARGGVTVTPDHATGELAFRLLNTTGFEVTSTTWPADRISLETLDELAKRVVAQSSRFA